MDREKIQKRQNFKIIASEALMVLAVVITVTILAFMVSGYWLNSDFEVERQGMLQISSIPTGANVDIDGESSWLQRTNTSKVLSSGKHTIVLSKDGYDTWTKTVDISEGLLYRVHYPRLFLENRKKESMFSVSGATMATISPKGNKLVLLNETTKWELVQLGSDTLSPKKIDIASYFSGTSLADGADIGVFSGKIMDADWDRSNTHILFKNQVEDRTEWVLIDTNNVKNSINLSKEFSADFASVKILDDTSNELLAVQDGNLRKINVADKSISAVLVEGVEDFDHFEDEVVFSAFNKERYALGLIRVRDGKITNLSSFSQPIKVVIFKFYDEMYIAVLTDNTVSLYNKKDFIHIQDFTMSFSPETIEVGHDGEFITMYKDNQIATLDMEAAQVHEWRIDGEAFGWLDNDMIYSVSDGDLAVYDFDGFNRRILAKNVSNHLPITITDDRWLYYFSDDKLVREWLVAR